MDWNAPPSILIIYDKVLFQVHNRLRFPALLLPLMYMEKSLVWYRTRKFWAVVYGLMFFWVSVFLSFSFLPAVNNINDFLGYLLATLGSSVFIVAGRTLGIEMYSVLNAVYAVFFVFLLFKTFESKLVNPIVAVILPIFVVIASVLNFLIIASFA